MSKATDGLMNYIRAMAGTLRNDPREDAELIARFVESRDETAFATLVGRHGVLVWQTCRRVLGDTPDVEDAFQTVFLVLTRKAGRFPVKNLVGWLYRVAHQTALKARLSAQRRRGVEKEIEAIRQPQTERDTNRSELFAALDEGLANLPERLRLPVLLHYMEGKTQDEVARILGCSRRTLRERLEKGEAILRKRLERRGLTLGAVSIAALLSDKGGVPTIPSRLVESTARAAVAFKAGTLAGGTESVQTLLNSLSLEGAARKFWWVVLVCFGTLGVGEAGLVAWRMIAEYSDTTNSESTVKTAISELKSKPSDGRVDCYGDPLPDGALARIGTVRFRPGTCLDTGDFPKQNCGAVFLPDSKTLVSVHGENTVYFWDVATGKELQRLEGPANSRQVTVSLDGKKLAVIGEKEIKVWNLNMHPPRVCFLKEHGGWFLKEQVMTVVFTPDSKALAISIAGNGGICLLDATTGEKRQEITYHTPNATGHVLSFTPDGNTLAYRDVLWDVKTKKKQKQLDLNGKNQRLRSLIFSPDGATFVTMEDIREGDGCSYCISFWDTVTGTRKYQQLANDVLCGDIWPRVAFLPDGHTVLEAGVKARSRDYFIRLWDASTGKAKTSQMVFCDKSYRTSGSIRCLSSDGKLLAKVSRQTISIWDVATRQEIGPTGAISKQISALAFAPDDKRLATLAHQRELQLWDTDTGSPQQEMQDLERIGLPFVGLRLVPRLDYSDSHRIEAVRFAVDQDNNGATFVDWDASSGKASEVPPLCRIPCGIKNNGYCCHGYGYAGSPDGRWQLLGSDAAGLVLIDRSAKKVAGRFPWSTEWGTVNLRCVDVSADGRSVLACYSTEYNSRRDANGMIIGGGPAYAWIEVWSAVTGKRLLGMDIADLPDAATFSDADNNLTRPTMALSPDGRQIAAVVNNEHEVRLWEVVSGTERTRLQLPVPNKPVRAVAWSPDVRHMAGGDEEGNVWLWSMTSGQVIQHFKGHRGRVRLLAFSRDGLRLGSASEDLTVLIWDLRGLPHQEVQAVQSQPKGDQLWAALNKTDADEAWRAMCLLVQHPDMALPLLLERLQPVPSPNPKRVAELITRLDHDDFSVRKQAKEELLKMGEWIKSPMREVLAKKPSAEVCESLNKLLDEISSSESLKASYRGVEVLERIGTSAAREVLEELSRLPEGLSVQAEATAALQRLARPMLVR